MGGEAPGKDDVDAALDSLEAELLDDVSDEVSEVVEESAPAAPPQLPARRPTGSTRRTAFDDLFVADSAPTSAVRGSPDDKIEYFRNKLKHAEGVIAGVREAWEVREREMDEFEAVAARDRQRAEEASQQRVALEQFFERKKAEFTAYIEKVTKAFTEKDETEKSLRGQIDELRAAAKAHGEELETVRNGLTGDLDEAGAEVERAAEQAEEVKQELEDTREALGHDIKVRDEAIAKLKSMVADQRNSVAERDAKIEEQMDAGAERDRAAARVLAEKEKLERALRSKSAAAQDDHQALGDLRETLERDIATRDGAIERLKAGIEETRKAIRERDITVEELRTELALVGETAARSEGDKVALEKQLRAEIETMKLSMEADQDAQGFDSTAAARDIAVRDEALERMKGLVEDQQRAVAERELQIETLEAQVAEAKREALRVQEQAVQQGAPVLQQDDAKTARLKKALHLADRLFFDLESGHPTLFDTREGTGEMLARLRKAVALARKAAEMI